MKRLLVMLGLMGSLVTAHAAPVKADGYTYVKTVGAIDEYTLASNGLQVLLLPDNSSPTLTMMITYRVGSKNEVTGTTGATHLLEHLMFKGTTQRDRSKGNNVDQLLERTGALYNATTWLDRTNYYQNLGSEHLATAIDMEADRMRNLLLREEDRKPEMTVVRNEFERGENNPVQSLYKELYQAAFVAHPYHHSTIGHRSDIEKVSIEKLREFYDTFYWPNNATVTIVGSFDPAAALALVKKSFGVYPKSPKAIPQVYTEEPAQVGPRRVTVKRAGQLGVVAIAHKIPAATHADYAAVAVFSDILADGKNSRLYKTITDKNLSTGVSTFPGYNSDPSLHIVFAPLAPSAKHDDVEKIALAEIERIKKDGVTEAEVRAAVAKKLADGAFQRDGSFAIAGNLNESIAAGDWSLFYTMDDALRKVTVADVQRVAIKYFHEDQSTTGWFIPTAAGGTAAPAAPAAKASLMAMPGPNYFRTPGVDIDGPLAGASESKGGSASAAPAVKVAAQAKRTKAAGIDLITYTMGVKDVVTIRGALPAGRSAATGNPAIPALTGMLLDQGTTKQDKFKISAQLESVGATINFRTANDTLEISAKALKKDLPLVMGLIAEQLRAPAFSAEEFEKAKKQMAGGLKRSLESTDFRAAEAFRRAIYPVGHPNHAPAVEDMLAAVESAKLEDVIAFHKAYYGPAQMTLVVVGDVDAKTVPAEVSRAFAGWQGGKAPARATKAAALTAPKELVVAMTDKTSVSVVIGQPSGLRYNEPDYQSLRVATAILGSGFTGRLMANVRDKEGLTYGVGASMASDTFQDGDWSITATFAPGLLDKGIESTKRQLTLWYDAGATAAEIDSRKSNLVGAFQVGLSTTNGMAGTLLATVQRGYPLNWIDDYPGQIRALNDAQINGAIKKYLNPDKMVLVKAGTLAATPAAPAAK
ncbi:MAG: insulinase family protein [Rhodoferax sp.]|nr:insulinase family protein [Rhodoferax sp.]